MTIPKTNHADLPVACTLTPEELVRRGGQFRAILTQAEERSELPAGYAFRYPGTEDWAARLNGLILGERDCCRFFAFALRFEPDLGPIWLDIQGPPGVKEMLT